MNILIQRILFLSAMMGTILFQTHAFTRNVSWIALSFLTLCHMSFAIYSAFFYSAFFIPAEIFPNSVFTFKHFHVSMCILLVSLFLKREWVQSASRNYQRLYVLLPWLVIVVISTMSTVFFQTHLTQALKTNVNVLSLILSASFLILIMDNKKWVRRAMQFFIGGTCFRVLLSFLTFLNLKWFYPPENFLHNNHFAFINCATLFLTLPFCLTCKQPLQRLGAWTVYTLLSVGLLVSLSRTGYVSFLISYLFFNILLIRGYWTSDGMDSKRNRRILLFIPILLMFLIVSLLLILFPVFTGHVPELQTGREFLDRLEEIGLIFQPKGWQQAFIDPRFRENFGLLGYLRRDQFFTLIDLLKLNWLTGVGFVRTVTDFHSLYLTLLGGTGIVGLALFLYFCTRWCQALWLGLFCATDDLQLFRAGVLSAFLVWLCYSFLETFFVQFHIWIVIVFGIMLSDPLQKSAFNR